MTRVPAYGDGDAAFTAPVYNAIINRSDVLRCIGACLGPNILPSPSEAPFRFDAQSAPLYVNRTTDAVDTSAHAPCLEELLDQQMWDPSGTRVVCLEGGRGCGKSTVMTYYLRCYCPHRSQRRDAFDRKFILVFDVGTVETAKDFSDNFFYSCQEWIRARCIEYGIDLSTMPPTTSVRQWVYTAIRLLSNQPSFKWLIIVFDDMDLAPPEVQRLVLAEVKRLLGLPQSRTYRIYVPMWPATLEILLQQGWDKVSLERISMTDIDRSDLIGTRFRAIRERVATTLHEVIDAEHGPAWVDYHERFCYDVLTQANCTFVRDLTDGDLRAELALWKGVLCGPVALESLAHSQRGRMTRYTFLDALLTGHYATWNPARSRIINVFRCGNATGNARDLLVGCHFAQLLANGVTDVEALVRVMSLLGYAKDSVKSVIRQFVHGNVIHRGFRADGRGVAWRICIHSRALSALIGLMSEPAYVDNAALITPIDEAIVGDTLRTVSYRESDFKARVASTMRLVKQIRSDEEEFVRSISRYAQPDKEAARAMLWGHNMYYVWKEIARKYRDRLEALKTYPYLRVEWAWFDDTLSDPMFHECGDTVEYITV